MRISDWSSDVCSSDLRRASGFPMTSSPLAPLYRACLWLAGLFMIALLVTILVSIAGRQFGFYLRGLDAYSGYCMAAASFLAQIGRAHVCTPVTNAHLVCRLLLEKKKSTNTVNE